MTLLKVGYRGGVVLAVIHSTPLIVFMRESFSGIFDLDKIVGIGQNRMMMRIALMPSAIRNDFEGQYAIVLSGRRQEKMRVTL